MNLKWCTRRTGISALSKTISGTVIVAALLATAACAPAETAASSASASPSPTGSVTPSPAPSGMPSPAPSATQILPPGADPNAGDGPQTAPTLPTEEGVLGETISFDTGIDIDIDSMKAIDVEAQTPGEVSGSAVALTITATNGSTQAQSVDSATVALVADDGEYAVGTTAGDPEPFIGEVAPGSSATAIYVFMLDPAADRAVTVSVNYGAGEPVAVFTGKVS